jgi:hypothetical protein
VDMTINVWNVILLDDMTIPAMMILRKVESAWNAQVHKASAGDIHEDTLPATWGLDTETVYFSPLKALINEEWEISDSSIILGYLHPRYGNMCLPIKNKNDLKYAINALCVKGQRYIRLWVLGSIDHHADLEARGTYLSLRSLGV